jgi:putative transposase
LVETQGVASVSNQETYCQETYCYETYCHTSLQKIIPKGEIYKEIYCHGDALPCVSTQRLWKGEFMLFQNKFRVETNRLSTWDYSANGYYYLTICTKNKKYLFGDMIDAKMQLSPIGEIALQEWKNSFVIRKELLCEEFIIMPNHIHAIVIIQKAVETQGIASISNQETQKQLMRKPKSISSFVGAFKSAVSKRINEIHQSPGETIWQERFYDHIIRDEKSLQKIREYIVNNPINWQTDEMR